MKPLGISKTSFRRFLMMNSTIRKRSIPWFQTASLSHDVRLKRSEDLRALREGKKPSRTKDSVDYRYRGKPTGLERQLDQSIEELWGDAAVLEEEKRQTNRSNEPNVPPSKTFVSFFDGVDEKMNDANANIYRKIGTNWKNVEKEEAADTSVNRLFDALQGNSPSGSSSSSGANVEHRSIFDAFPLKSKTNPNAYEKQAFTQYHELMKEILKSDKFCRKQTKRPIKEDILQPIIEWLLRDEQTLYFEYGVLKDAGKYGISMNTCTSDSDDSSHSNENTKKKKKEKKTFQEEVFIKDTQASSFYSQLMKQKESFSKKTGMSEEELEIAGRALDILTSHCAKSAKSAPLAIAWEKSKEAGIIPSNDTLNVYLYVTGTSGLLSSALSGSLSVTGGRKKPSAVMMILGNDRDGANAIAEVKDDPIDFPTELAIFHDLLYKPTEKSVSLRVKRLVLNGDAAAAEKLLDSFPSSDDARLRTYLPVLKLYCEQGNVSSALKLFKRMRDEPSVRLEPENYVLLISTLAENGYFKSTSTPVEGLRDIGYTHESGAGLFDEMVSEMSEDVLEISAASARRLYNSLAEGLKDELFTNKVEPIHSLAGVAMINEKAAENDLIASRVTVGKSTGTCPRSGVTLRLIKLEREEQKQLHNSLLDLSRNRFEEFTGKLGRKGHQNANDDYAAEKLNDFSAFLNQRKGRPFTAIIDGANICYYMQNFDQGCFNYHQLQFVVDALEKSNEMPLIVLPYKYCSKSFNIRMGTKSFRQTLSKDEFQIIDKLHKNGQLYRVPAQCLDDYYWMLASVSDQTLSRNGANLDVPHDNREGRWPGTRPMLVTNDQMRDHKLGLMEPRLFRRWTSCYIVNYCFTAFVREESIDREISFSTADFFSREIQANDTSTGIAWHFPVSDWSLDDRLCVRIPRNKK